MTRSFNFCFWGVGLIATISLSGCASAKRPFTDASRIQHIPAITLTDDTQRKSTKSTKSDSQSNPDQRQSLSVEAWVTEVVQIESGKDGCNSKGMYAVLCFENFFDDYPFEIKSGVSVVEKVVPLVAVRVVPDVVEKVVPDVVEKVVPDVAEKVVPLVAEKVVPLVAEKVVPLVAEKVVPLVAEKVVPLVAEKVVPLAVEKVVPLAVEKVVPLAVEKVVPLAVEKVVPLAVEKVVPLAVKKVVPLAVKKVVPLAVKKVVPLAVKKVVPLAVKKVDLLEERRGRLRNIKKGNLRNQFIMQAITISDVNCSSRIDRVFSVESSGDMFTGIVTKLLGTGGILASDAATSRAASAAVLGIQTSWDALGESFLAGAQMNTIVTAVKKDRETREKAIYKNMYKPSEVEDAEREINLYSEYSLAEAVRDVIQYDDACDLFK